MTAQALDGQMQGGQRGRAGRINRQARPAKVENVRETVGADAVGVAETRVGVITLHAGAVLDLQVQVIVRRDAYEDASLLAREALQRKTGIFKGAPRDLQQQSLLRVNLSRFMRGD